VRILCRLPLLALLSCAPHWADRAVLTADGSPGPLDRSGDRRGAVEPVDAAPDTAAERRADEVLASDQRAADRLPDRPPDTSMLRVTDSAAAPDVVSAPDAATVPAALLVVGDALAPTAGDARLLLLLASSGLRVQLASDTDPADITGVGLVVLAASCTAANLAARYRDLPVPIVSMEPAVFDDLGMTGAVAGVDWEETPGTQVSVVLPSHPMAAGLAGTVAVVSAPATLTWGRPAATAQLVATFEGLAGQAAIFGYPAQAAMVAGRAPARRVGFFAADEAASRLTEPGALLFAAAVRWALR
jgi:hypothetical protein